MKEVEFGRKKGGCLTKDLFVLLFLCLRDFHESNNNIVEDGCVQIYRASLNPF